MAVKGLSTIRVKRKEKGRTRTEVYALNSKYLGSEPTYSPGHIITDVEKSRSYQWYSYMCTPEEAREYLVTFYAKRKDRERLQAVKRVKDSLVPLTAAWIARLDDLGVNVGPSSLEFVSKKVDELSKYERDKEESSPPRVTIADRVNSKVDTFIGNLEKVYDEEDWTFDVYEALKANGFPTTVSAKIADYYEPLADEVRLVIANTDPDLYQGYKHMSKKDLKSRLTWLEETVKGCRTYGKNEKKARAPRKQKAPSVEKLLKNFVYQKEDVGLKLASCNPADLIGCQEAWLYDTRYRVLTVLRADGPSGLRVNRRTLEGWNPETSESKSVGRVFAEILPKVRDGGKLVLRGLMKTIGNKKHDEPKFRSSENTIVVRVIK